MRFLQTTALALTIGLTATATQANELKQVWGGGSPDVSFYSGEYVPFVIDTLEKNRLSGYKWAGPSDGTPMNAKMVTENPTHLAVGQYDVLQKLQEQDGYDFTILHKNLGYECMYMLTKNPNYETFGHVLGNAWDITIGTGSKDSGSFATLSVLQDMYPDLQAARVENVGSLDDIVENVSNGRTNFGFFIMRPDPGSKVFEQIEEQNLTLVPVADFGLENDYEIKNLKIANGGLLSDATYHTTACTTVSMITGNPDNVSDDNPRVKRRLQATIDRIGPLDSEKLRKQMVERTTTWADFLDNVKDSAGEKTRQLMEKSKKAAENLRNEMSN